MIDLLNNGLATSEGAPISAQEAQKALTTQGFSISLHGVVNSTTEPTLVAQVTPPAAWRGREVYAHFFSVARVLRQDCIAVFSIDACRGALIGPAAEKWGDFRPGLFYLADGQSLDPA